MPKQAAKTPEELREDLAKFHADTLSGDLRDKLLTEFKNQPELWQKADEDQQQRMIDRATDIAEETIKNVIDVLAMKGFEHIPVKVGKFTVDGIEVKGTYEAIVQNNSILQIQHLSGKRALFILADPAEYFGETSAPEPEQRKTPLEQLAEDNAANENKEEEAIDA